MRFESDRTTLHLVRHGSSALRQQHGSSALRQQHGSSAVVLFGSSTAVVLFGSSTAVVLFGSSTAVVLFGSSTAVVLFGSSTDRYTTRCTCSETPMPRTSVDCGFLCAGCTRLLYEPADGQQTA